MNGKSLAKPNSSIVVSFPKTLDMADTYDSSDPYDGDEEPTVKIQVPNFHPQVVVKAESTYPGVGLIIAITFGLLFWGSLYYFFR